MTTELVPTIIYDVEDGMEGIVTTGKTTLTASELKYALGKIAEAAKDITAEDLSDDVALAKVGEARKRLGKIRISVKKQSKAQRDQYTVLARANSAVENELIGIIEPEEERLASLVDEARVIKERAARAALLPMRKEMVAQFPALVITDEELLDMDVDQFNAKLNEWTAAKLQADRDALEAEKAKLARDAELREAAAKAVEDERARVDAQAKVDEAAKVAAEVARQEEVKRAAQKIIDDANAEASRIARVAEEQAAQKKIEEAAKEQQEKATAWFISIGYTKDNTADWYIQHTAVGMVAYMKVSEFKF